MRQLFRQNIKWGRDHGPKLSQMGDLERSRWWRAMRLNIRLRSIRNIEEITKKCLTQMGDLHSYPTKFYQIRRDYLPEQQWSKIPKKESIFRLMKQ